MPIGINSDSIRQLTIFYKEHVRDMLQSRAIYVQGSYITWLLWENITRVHNYYNHSLTSFVFMELLICWN